MPKKSNERTLRRVLNESVEYRKKVSNGQPFHKMVQSTVLPNNPQQLVAMVENSINYAVQAKQNGDHVTALMLSHNVILLAATLALCIHNDAGATFGDLTEMLEMERSESMVEQVKKEDSNHGTNDAQDPR